MQLHDRVVLITGGKRIGADVALALAARGADVALCYRESRTEAEATAHAVRKLGRRAQLIQADLRAPADCRRAVAETVSALGRLDVLVNMASVYARKPYLELTDEDWDRSLGGGSASRPPVRAGGRAAHACGRGGAHRQFHRLGRGEPAPPLRRVSALLRRENGRDRADGSAGAGAGGRQHPRQCGRARSDHPA